jgi:Ca-activated chloride channel family protein
MLSALRALSPRLLTKIYARGRVIMAKIWMALLLSAMVLMGWHPSSGSDVDSDNKEAWYNMSAPADAGNLTDEGREQGESGLWIVDAAEKEKRNSSDIPMGVWARLKLIPASSGELEFYCRYPTESVDLLLSGQVEMGHAYRAWYHTELEGDYELWYTLQGMRSDSIHLNVTGEPVLEMAVPSGMSNVTGISNATAPAPVPIPMTAPAPMPAMAGSGIGLSVGGAKDINNFRDNIEQGYLPLPSDITYEGLFYDYYFDIGQGKECQKLFCPSYSYAISRDPFSSEPQHYLSVGLDSGIQDFQRPKLNLVVVLDYSGSMGSPFDEYYYDRFGNRIEVPAIGSSQQKKIDIADQAVVDLLGHLKEDDRFGLVIFSDEAFLADPLTLASSKNLTRLKEQILKIQDYSGTNMEAGMEKASRLFGRYSEANKSEYENRIVFLTDAMPNIEETSETGLFKILKDNADRGVYSTLIGIGVDFNSQLVENITKIRGANYYSVHSAGEFKERMDDEFDFMVTPLVFDLLLSLNATGFEIEKVYGSPEADEATGEILKVNTLFPSKKEDGEVKGGVILVKLKKLSPEGQLKLKVSYQDRSGREDSDEAEVEFNETIPDFYQNSGIHKAILLSRYADLLKDWIVDERSGLQAGQVVPTVTLESGILIPVELGEWERQSLPLQVSEPYRKLFALYAPYFEKERKSIGDSNLQQEEVVLKKLSSFENSGGAAGYLSSIKASIYQAYNKAREMGRG